ncbi:hypothetical protein [Actinobaculum suis]|uniref:hypothetical protein n=1 Tax=Actinobaculum suis TaxID=1657 RepID=UPI000B0DCDEC|nr:hypothetical protein [Actinobaculum suis]
MSGLRPRARHITNEYRWNTYVARRGRYMKSRAWYKRRRDWFVLQRQRTGKPVECAGCGRHITERNCDMHHVTYARLGAEKHEDLLAMCRACHEALHVRLDASKSLRSWIQRAPLPNTLALLEMMRGQYRAGRHDREN